MKEFDLASEYLAELLERDPTEQEVEEFMEQQEARAYDSKESEMKGN